MHCPASGIRGTVYPVVYGKSEILKLFHIMENIFITVLFCELCPLIIFVTILWTCSRSPIFSLSGPHLSSNQSHFGLKDNMM